MKPEKRTISTEVSAVSNILKAEENQDITLEWTFSTRRDTSLSSISTICQMFTDGRSYFLFHLHQGIESPESQDPEFAGRVQWDKDVLTEGRLTLHVSRLRTNDSGFYLLKSSNLRDHQRVHNQRVHNQRVHNQRVHNQRVHNQRVAEDSGLSL
ncbi:hypothetical protein F7725_004871 [Dissostichus mawsoni]|uniref:Immunoglobulin V-set domain-containing protein n=1 Tax=Dissostichus mawsoni TaxID=36200 RepID=A0A7J5XLG0_DISMA|nr:hypothetical protein F7725_004871 [Dissostichus mawsoni]